jgi:hypothetical protein
MDYSTMGMGPIIALIGLILLLVTNLQRQAARKHKSQASSFTLAWVKWGSLAAYLLIMIGLLIMTGRK